MDGGDGGGVVEVAVVDVVAVILAEEVVVVTSLWNAGAIDPTALHRCISSCSATIKPHPIFMTELCASNDGSGCEAGYWSLATNTYQYQPTKVPT